MIATEKKILILVLPVALLLREVCADAPVMSVYSPTGKRDPFRSYTPDKDKDKDREPKSVEPIQKFGVDQFELRAILKGTTKSQAMFQDPEGNAHILGEGDLIGKEKALISRILSAEVIITQKTFNYLGVEKLYEKIVSLPEK